MSFVFLPSKIQENPHWVEEREECAVWGVVLKKIRYQRPSSTLLTDQQEKSNRSGSYSSSTGSAIIDEVDHGEIAHLMWETVRVRVLRAGTLRKIVEAMYNEDVDVQVML